jgi:hypothetical protein
MPYTEMDNITLATLPSYLNGLERNATVFLAGTERGAWMVCLDTIVRWVSFAEEPDVGRSSRQGCNLAGESPVVSVARVGHVVMPHPGMGNHPGYAWCKRPGRPVDCCGGCDLEA